MMYVSSAMKVVLRGQEKWYVRGDFLSSHPLFLAAIQCFATINEDTTIMTDDDTVLDNYPELSKLCAGGLSHSNLVIAWSISEGIHLHRKVGPAVDPCVQVSLI